MPYPSSPFGNNFNYGIIIETIHTSPDTTITNFELEETLKWLCSFPQCTTYRVNTLISTVDDAKCNLQKHIDEVLNNDDIKVIIHPILNDVLTLKHCIPSETLECYEKQVIIDPDCASAVLRGAHIYAPGVMGMLTGTIKGDKVSIYVDLSKKCKKGLQKLYVDGEKFLIGNGIARMQRYELFGENIKPSGVAVQVTETISGCPPLGDHILENEVLLQNIPSIICVHNLNPEPNDVILDMCASPGNKTTHIAALMKNQGTLVALDKTPSKINHLKSRCENFGARAYIFQADSTKIIDEGSTNSPENGPPYKTNMFDKILLDAPCSALGKRPQLINNSSEKVVKSYGPLQKKLFKTAVNLLKPNGILVYSTCTITLAENEGLVAWALQNFDCLELIPQKIHLGGYGWSGTTLLDDQRKLIQRFGFQDDTDSVGFFISCFKKR